MSCHDARESFSAFIDDALDAGGRGRLEEHLAGCAECRRELERFRRAVALVKSLPAERAPAGFVDRVTAATEQAPWHVRLARGLFVPWTAKLPMEAAAVLLIAGLAVIVFQRMPEQQRAARLEEPAAPTPPASAPPTQSAGPPRAPAQQQPTAPPALDASRKRDDAGRAAAESRTSAARQESMRAASAADLSGRLATDDPATAASALVALARRLGGAVRSVGADDGERVLDLTLPRDRYADFTAEVSKLGRWQPGVAPSSLPETVRISVHVGR